MPGLRPSKQRATSVRINNANDDLPSFVLGEFSKSLKEHAKHVKRQRSNDDFAKYRNNPVSFIEEVLKEKLTRDQKDVADSVLKNELTWAQSANAVGKTFLAACLIVWFYKCFTGAQVVTSAAPPENNLKTLLWGEIQKLVKKNKMLFKDDEISFASMKIYRKEAPEEWIQGFTIPVSGDEAIAEAKFSGKHAPSQFFVFDECDAIPEVVFSCN